jgi:hypothetical protein
MEKKVGIETVEFDHDARRDREPDGRKHRGGGQKLFHGLEEALEGLITADLLDPCGLNEVKP